MKKLLLFVLFAVVFSAFASADTVVDVNVFCDAGSYEIGQEVSLVLEVVSEGGPFDYDIDVFDSESNIIFQANGEVPFSATQGTWSDSFQFTLESGTPFGTGLATGDVDGIQGTAFFEVGPASAPAPEFSRTTMIIVVLLVAAAVFWYIKKKK